MLGVGCDDGSTSVGDTATRDTATHDTATGNNTGNDSTEPDTTPVTLCGLLFGVPSAQTGLDESQCQPTCTCDGPTFTPTRFTGEQLAALSAMVLQNSMPALASDPYLTPGTFVETPEKVCALLFDGTDPTAYTLETYASKEAALAAGATITHEGACGLCSSLADLAVYIGIPDLTSPVRQCGIEGFSGGEEASMACLRALGFTENCAQIWYYNTLNTRTHCTDTCLSLLTAPYHDDNGNINACLDCDERLSGPVFKAVSGRTRRNSGLPTGICRPCESISPINHKYFK